jgi:SAM-dependent methyltransferase
MATKIQQLKRVKAFTKRLLSKVGLLKAGRVAYSFLKGVSPAVIGTELRARMNRRATRVPPQRLIFYVIGYRWAKVYLDSGSIIVDAMVKHLRAAGIEIATLGTVLDFGCGCGRMIRHLPKHTNAALSGCDYNAELIAWDQRNLPFAEFRQNELAPPLPYPDNSFDLVYARSVFTHLTEELQLRWIAELRRVLKPRGVLYFTTHGRQFFAQLSLDERERVERGESIVHDASEEGHNVCTSFELDGFVRQKLGRGFDVLGYYPGQAGQHLQQDAYVLRKQTVAAGEPNPAHPSLRLV